MSTVFHIFCICLLQHLIEATVNNTDSESSIHTQGTVFLWLQHCIKLKYFRCLVYNVMHILLEFNLTYLYPWKPGDLH